LFEPRTIKSPSGETFSNTGEKKGEKKGEGSTGTGSKSTTKVINILTKCIQRHLRVIEGKEKKKRGKKNQALRSYTTHKGMQLLKKGVGAGL